MSVNSHLAVMRGPFSSAAAGAKVPDGRISASLGSRESGCNCYVHSETSGSFVFCLQPNIACGLQVYGLIEDASSIADPKPKIATILKDPQSQAIYDPENGIDKINSLNAPDKFRIVSAGLRLSCVNAAEYNNGWFEAIRVNTEFIPTDFVANNKPETGTAPTPDFFIPSKDFENNLLSSSRWCNHPSYVTGKLSTLYKHQFYLQNIEERHFVKNDTTSSGYDNNFDFVFVRVHTVASNNVKPAIHWHVVHNLEFTYDAGSVQSRYHSPCIASPSMVAKVDKAIKRDPKASIIRSPSSIAYNP